METSQKNKLVNNNKEYICVGWSAITFKECEKKYNKSKLDEIIENSKFYTSENGYYYDQWFYEITPLLQRWGGFYFPTNYPDFIFVFDKFLVGTYIFKIDEQ